MKAHHPVLFDTFLFDVFSAGNCDLLYIYLCIYSFSLPIRMLMYGTLFLIFLYV